MIVAGSGREYTLLHKDHIDDDQLTGGLLRIQVAVVQIIRTKSERFNCSCRERVRYFAERDLARYI